MSRESFVDRVILYDREQGNIRGKAIAEMLKKISEINPALMEILSMSFNDHTLPLEQSVRPDKGEKHGIDEVHFKTGGYEKGFSIPREYLRNIITRYLLNELQEIEVKKMSKMELFSSGNERETVMPEVIGRVNALLPSTKEEE